LKKVFKKKEFSKKVSSKKSILNFLIFLIFNNLGNIGKDIGKVVRFNICPWVAVLTERKY